LFASFHFSISAAITILLYLLGQFPEDCYEAGTITFSTVSGDAPGFNPMDCLSQCKDFISCNYWTWYKNENFCQFFENFENILLDDEGNVYGERDCPGEFLLQYLP